jgi:hypothetical protein
MTMESDFSKAVGKVVEKAVQKAVQKPVQFGADSGAATGGKELQTSARNDITPCETRCYATVCDGLQYPAKYISGEDRTRTTLENAGKTGVPQESGTESGTVGAQLAPIDPDLAAVVNAWPTLPETTRRQIAATIREAVGSHGVGDGGAR